MKNAFRLLGSALGLVLVAAAPAPESVVEARLAVEDLASRLRSERELAQGELASLHRERLALQERIRIERARKAALERIAREVQDVAAAHDAESLRWSGPSRAAIEVARASVRRSLPFLTQERLAALDRIEAELVGHGPDVALAMERLWRFLEEESAMASEVAMARQAVVLERPGGQVEAAPRLVEVLRFGMALLYLRTFEGEVGWAKPVAGGWRFELLTDPVSQSVVRELFTAHEGNATFGPAELLLPLELGGEASPG